MLNDQPDTSAVILAERRARPWRVWLTGWGLLLAACFFLPAVAVCSSDCVPAVVLCHYLSPPCSADNVIRSLLVCGACYAFGLVVAFGAAWRLLRGHRSRRWPWAMFGTTVLPFMAGLGLACLELFAGDPGTPWFSVSRARWCLIFCISGLYLFRVCLHPRRRACLGLTFVGAVLASAWFGFVAFDEEARYGLVLSLIASLGLVIGAVGEARALTAGGWLRTSWSLLLCRLPPFEGREGRCPKCDYLLYGLTERRCPECGRPFTAQEAGRPPGPAVEP